MFLSPVSCGRMATQVQIFLEERTMAKKAAKKAAKKVATAKPVAKKAAKKAAKKK